MAASTAARSCSSPNGFLSSAVAPPSIAWARSSRSSSAVMKTIGRSIRWSRKHACTSKPVIPCMRMSRTRHAGRRVASDFRNSGPEAYVSTSYCAERSRRVSAFRIGNSSSTTATIAAVCSMIPDRVGGPGTIEADEASAYRTLDPVRARRSMYRQHPHALDQPRQLRERLDVHLAHHPGAVDLDRLQRRAELVGGLLVEPAGDDAVEDLSLARGQAGEPLSSDDQVGVVTAEGAV